MARKPSPNPNTPLVLFLVFFVILSIGLGVAAWYGYRGQDELREVAKKKEEETATARLGERYALFLVRDLRRKTEYGKLDAAEEGQWATGEQDYKTGAFSKVEKDKGIIDVMFAELSKDLQANNQHGTKLKDIVRRLSSKLSETQTELATAQKELADTNTKLAAVQTKYDSEWKKALKAIQDSAKNSLDAAEKQSKEMERVLLTNRELDTKLEKQKEDADLEVVKLKAEVKKLDEQITKMKDQPFAAATTTTAQEQHALLLDISKGKPLWDAPVGKIVRAEADGRTVTINLGSASGVKPQLTFNVFAAGKDGRADGPFKGTIEVTRILDASTAQARITSLYDENGQEIALNDPARGRLQREAFNTIKEGDLLFHLAWGTHVVVAGRVNWAALPTDNPGEQMRNLHAFLALLTRQGVIVDGYLDLTNAEFKGSFTDKTRYMIRGDFLLEEKVEAKTDEEGKPVKEEAGRAGKINEAIRALRKDASDKGVFIISADNFANVIGYREPRSALSVETGAFRPGMPVAGAFGSGVLRVISDRPAAAEAPKEEMKKENGKNNAK